MNVKAPSAPLMSAYHASESSLARGAADAVRRLFQLLRLEKQGLSLVVVHAIGIGVASLAAPVGVQMLCTRRHS